MTALRLLLTGLALLALALLMTTAFFTPWLEPRGLFTVRGLSVLALTLVGCGSIVSAGLVSALTAVERPTAAPEPAVDHFA